VDIALEAGIVSISATVGTEKKPLPNHQDAKGAKEKEGDGASSPFYESGYEMKKGSPFPQEKVSIIPMMTNVEPLLRLPKKERMEVAEKLWLSVADEQRMPVSAEHKRVISERLASYQEGKSVPVPHAEMMKRLRSK